MSAAIGSVHEREQLGGVQVGQRVEQACDLGRLQAGDLAVVVLPVAGRVGVASQKLEVLPVDQLALRATSEHSVAEAAQHRPGTGIRARQPQVAILLAEPQVVGAQRLAPLDVDDQGIHDVAASQHCVRQRLVRGGLQVGEQDVASAPVDRREV